MIKGTHQKYLVDVIRFFNQSETETNQFENDLNIRFYQRTNLLKSFQMNYYVKWFHIIMYSL